MKNRTFFALLYISILAAALLSRSPAVPVAAQTIPGAEPPPRFTTCTGLTAEAESGRLFGEFVIAKDANASGGSYIQTPAVQPERNLERTSANIENYVEFCFNVERAGTYRIRGLIYASSGLNNSFFVTVDGSPADTYLWVVPVNSTHDSTYKLDYVTVDASEETLEIELTAGEHIVRISERERGTRLDKLELEFKGDNHPPTLSHPGDQRGYVGESIAINLLASDEDGNILTYRALGLPDGLTIDPVSGVISGMLEQATEAPSYVVLYADDGTTFATSEIVWEVGTEPVLQCAGLAQEGESGQLYRKMVVVEDPEASGGAYVTNPSPVTPADERSGIYAEAAEIAAASIDRKHRADFCVQVSAPGTYRLRARVYAPAYFQNSFFVQIDGQPLTAYLWDILPISQDYSTDYVSQRGGADPVLFSLEKGDHVVSFISRENSTRLDSFVLEPVEVAVAETEEPTEDDINNNLIEEAIAEGRGQVIYVPAIAR